MMFPKKKWSRPLKSKTMRAVVPEHCLQSFADGYLQIRKLWFFRIPDGFFGWMKIHAPENILKYFMSVFGGMPDDTVIIPIGGGIALTLLMELKTQDSKGRAVGQLHGRQKHHEDDWVVCRSPEQIQKVVDEFEKTANKIKVLLENKRVTDASN